MISDLEMYHHPYSTCHLLYMSFYDTLSFSDTPSVKNGPKLQQMDL